MDNNILAQFASGFAILTSTGFWGHYWATKRSKEKDYTDFKQEIGERVLLLESTTVKESDVKHIIDEANKPLSEGISEIKEMMKNAAEATQTLQEDITEIKIREAHREGMEAARAEVEREHS